MQYDVRALSAANSITHITIEAGNEDDVRRQVEALGLYATTITPVRSSLLPALRLGGSRSGRLSLVLFSQELLALLSAGLGIVEGLEALLEKEFNDSARTVLTRLLTGLHEGKRFSNVLAEQPEIFPPLYIGIIKAAEGTSDLPRSLARYIEYRQRIDSVRSKIISASIYPVILFLVGGGVTLFLIGYVVPRFAEVYKGAGRQLPWLSQCLLDWGQFASDHQHSLLITAGTSVFLAILGLRHLLVHDKTSQLLARLPGIKDRSRIYELSRLYLTLGMLLEGGIPVVSAMETVHGVVSADVKRGLRNATDRIASGEPLSDAFEEYGLTTPISLRMLRVGERSGALGPMLIQSAAFHDGEISRWIDRFTRSFEPTLMAAIGLVVGAIVVLLYMPIFDLAGSLS
jgi:general secretion pathway protein F